MEKGRSGVFFAFAEPESVRYGYKGRWLARRRRALWTLLYCIATFVVFLNGFLFLPIYRGTSSPQFAAGPANATLGFGAIYAVSRPQSPRRVILERSAVLTGLEIKIPNQPVWKEGDVEGIRAVENSTINRGSALAWLGHLNALKRFLNSPYETALIVEDDIDYDTHIRTEQIPSTAYAIRELLESQHQSKYYYGDPALWDILWLGHCGDYFNATAASQVSPIKTFTDITLPMIQNLHPWTQDFLRDIGATEEQRRLVHRSVNPRCTFAYAVTKKAAAKLVYDFAAREPSRPPEHPCIAFDVRLLEACRDGGFGCVTVSPELFHHTSMPSEIDAIPELLEDMPRQLDDEYNGNNNHQNQDNNNNNDNNDSDDHHEHEIQDDFFDNDEEELPGPNIRCSARSDLWWNNRRRPADTPRLLFMREAMRELAQRPGECYLETLR